MSSRSTIRPATRSASLSALLIRGADARAFLQGQLSADIDALSPSRALLASCNSVQGRVQAVLWLIDRSDGIAVIVPTSMVELTTARLRKYVLRSKVTFDTPGHLTVATLEQDALPAQVSLADSGAHAEHDGTSYLRVPGHEQVLVVTALSTEDVDAAAELNWRLAHVRAGLPQVYPATHEAFVAQMLNLDLLGGVSFEKGCYTGQEIIARTHFRGAIKRRMFRFSCACPPPAPGARILTGDQHAGDIVDAAPAEEGCELLAVISLAQKNEPLELEESRGVRLHMQPLPYEVTGGA